MEKYNNQRDDHQFKVRNNEGEEVDLIVESGIYGSSKINIKQACFNTITLATEGELLFALVGYGTPGSLDSREIQRLYTQYLKEPFEEIVGDEDDSITEDDYKRFRI